VHCRIWPARSLPLGTLFQQGNTNDFDWSTSFSAKSPKSLTKTDCPEVGLIAENYTADIDLGIYGSIETSFFR
jgi:hypothetical protein